MAATNGKWKLVSEQKVEEFINATGGGQKELKEYLESQKNEIYETYTLDGDCLIKTTEDGAKSSTIEIHLGKWCDRPSKDGVSKLLVKGLGNGEYGYSLVNKNYKVTGTRVFTGDDMVLDLISMD